MTTELVRKNRGRFLPSLTAGLLAMSLALAAPASAQTGAITGTIVSAETGEPLSAAQVSVEGTGLGALTQANGRFLILRVPTGTYTVEAILIGFASARQGVTVTEGESAVIELRMAPQAISLSEIVVTGTAGATQRTKLAFDVAQVRASDIQVPNVNVGNSLSGKVAGVTVVQGSGRPGAAPSILLRGPTMLDASGRDQDPLYIVDGVILGASLVDLDALDIQSVEVVKGAAAASLYGSRAANGVIQIRTKRGRAMADDQVRYTVRSEYGQSELASTPEDLLTEVHNYAVGADGLFIQEDGTTCAWLQCNSPALAGQWAAPGDVKTAWNTVQDVAWPGQTYNQVERFFETGQFMQNYVSAEGRSGATQGNPLFDLTRMPAGVDLLSLDSDGSGELVLNVDPTNNESPNPLYEMFNRKYTEDHGRFLGSTNLRYTPRNWVDIDLNGSYDRLDTDVSDFYPKGYRTITPSSSLNDGQLYKFRSRREALNASVTATLRHDFGERIRNRTQVRYLYEDQDYQRVDADGYRFAVGDVPTLDNIDQETLSSGSYDRTIRADGYFAITNFDIYDKYVVDALVRNDGSSLFGEDARRQWYYRIAGAWRLTEEPFFSLPGVDELKLRYSLGTAGGRPNFEAQYETYSVSGGRVSPVNLGNNNLKPEFSREHEVGLDAAMLNNRVSLALTYALSNTKDQILPVPQAAYTGYQTQWRNAGNIQSKSFEATLDVRLVDTDDFSWSAKVLFDRTRSEITELYVPPFNYGVGGQGLGSVFYARAGEEVGTFYGVHYATSCADLPVGTPCDGFAVNDEGWLVWVGPGGFGTPQWGTGSDVDVRGSSVMWGTPFAGECTDPSTGERTLFCPVGNSIPDFNLNLAQSFSYRGLNLYALLSHSSGFDVYNQPLQWGTFKRFSGIMDQRGIPQAEQKPVGYFDALYGVSGLQPSNVFVEDGTFTKLREVSLSYRFNADQLAAVPGLDRFSGVGLSVTGRNLFTITDYRGFDPEVGKTGGDTGSSALARVEGYQYPNFRTWTAALEFIF
ncbi:MAG: TonB-dependent receptor [Gemmatimonadota bacterium]